MSHDRFVNFSLVNSGPFHSFFNNKVCFPRCPDRRASIPRPTEQRREAKQRFRTERCGRVLFQSPGLAFVASWERGTGLWRFRPVPVHHRLPASKSRNRLFPGSLPRVVAAPREAPPSSVTRSRLSATASRKPKTGPDLAKPPWSSASRHLAGLLIAPAQEHHADGDRDQHQGAGLRNRTPRNVDDSGMIVGGEVDPNV